MRGPLLLVGLLFLAQAAVAREPSAIMKDAQDEVATELAHCAAYYAAMAVGSEGASVPKDILEKSIQTDRDAFEGAIQLSARLTSQRTALARLKLFNEQMARDLKDGMPWAELMSQNMMQCKELLEHSDKRLLYWITEKSKQPDLK